jgi:hypothetical protein
VRRNFLFSSADFSDKLDQSVDVDQHWNASLQAPGQASSFKLYFLLVSSASSRHHRCALIPYSDLFCFAMKVASDTKTPPEQWLVMVRLQLSSPTPVGHFYQMYDGQDFP